MKDLFQVKGKLNILGRKSQSKMGNPKFSCEVLSPCGELTTFNTATNCRYGYSIENFSGKFVCATLGTHYNDIALYKIEEVASNEVV